MEENNMDVTIAKALKSFLCFLYVGDDRPYYDATKSWKNEDYYSQGKHMRNLEILVSEKKYELVPLDKIKLAMDSCLIRKPDTLMFALAMCARQKKSEKLRSSVYYFVTEHCKAWKYFISFVGYMAYLCRVESSEKDANKKASISSGRGWRNAVNKWYLNHDAMDLAILVGRYKSAHGLKHKDILRLSHIDFLNVEVAKQVVFVYALDGLNAASRKFENELEAKNQLDYLKRVEKFRTCKDPKIVAEMLSNGDFTIDHVHPSVLNDESVWKSLLPGMDIRSILKYLPKIAQLGFLKKGSTLTEIVVKILTDQNNLSWNKILPGEILEILNLYEGIPNRSQLFRHRLANVEYEERFLESECITEADCLTEATRRIWVRAMKLAEEEDKKKELEDKEKKIKKIGEKPQDTDKDKKMKKEPVKIKSPNVQIKGALQTALNLSQKVDITGCNEKYYVVGIKMPPINQKKISCSEVGLTIALPLLYRYDAPEDATTIIFHDQARGHGFIPEISKEWGFDKTLVHTLKLSKDTEKYIKMPGGPMAFCMSEKRKCDVFINVTNLPPIRPPPENAANLSINQVIAAINSVLYWKKHPDCQQTRFVNILLNKAPFELKGTEWDDVLTIRGFDTNVPFIIEAYVRGLF